MALVTDIYGFLEQQSGARRLGGFPMEKTVTAHVDKNRADRPGCYAPAGSLHKGQHEGAIQLAMDAKNSFRRQAAIQQDLDHGGLVTNHGSFAWLWRCYEQSKTSVGINVHVHV